jgi:DNA-binding HxlR family transcriptional regulator
MFCCFNEVKVIMSAVKDKRIINNKSVVKSPILGIYYHMNVNSPVDQLPLMAADHEADHAADKISEFCPIYAELFDMLSRRWMGIILRVLMSGPHRFSEILAAVPGLSDPLLTQRLRELEARKVVERHVIPASPVRVEYRLTEAGRDLETTVRTLSRWAEKWMKAPEPPAERA